MFNNSKTLNNYMIIFIGLARTNVSDIVSSVVINHVDLRLDMTIAKGET